VLSGAGPRCGAVRQVRTVLRRRGFELVDDRQIASVHGANALSDFGGAASVVLVRIGDALALYKTLAGNKLEDNLNPVRRIYYAGSTMGACRHHCRSRWAPHSACRPTKPSCEKSSPRAFEVSGAPFNMILDARR
jgi:hypothetical protein